MSQTPEERLGLLPYGARAPVGNVLTYPRRIFLEVLRRVYAEPSLFTNISDQPDEDARNPYLFIQNEDRSTSSESKILIVDSNTEHSLNLEVRPRIVVDRGPNSFLQGNWAQKKGSWGSQEGSGQAYVALCQSSVSIRCVARARIDSELLALSVHAILWFLHDTIRKNTKLFSLERPQIGPTMAERIDSTIDQFNTPITIETVMPLSWNTFISNPTRLEEICAEFVNR